MMHLNWTGALTVALVSTSVFGAGFELTSRSSFVSVAGDIVGQGKYADEISYDEFDGFDEEIEGIVEYPPLAVAAESFAWQYTFFDPMELTGFGESWASWVQTPLGDESGSAFADSLLELEFTLTENVLVSFSGELTTEGDEVAIAEALIKGPVIVEFNEDDGAFSWEGVLPAGDYFLGVDAFTRVTGDADTVELFARAQFDFLLTIIGFPPPCEGDANGDFTVDPLDSGYVLARFGCPVREGDPSCDAADQNGDGVVDPLDSGFVLARFGECSWGSGQVSNPVLSGVRSSRHSAVKMQGRHNQNVDR